jgi:hypothetical protein
MAVTTQRIVWYYTLPYMPSRVILTHLHPINPLVLWFLHFNPK